MNKNIGFFDRFFRTILVFLIFYVYYIGWFDERLVFVAIAITALLLYTVLTGECQVYNWLGISTKQKIKTS